MLDPPATPTVEFAAYPVGAAPLESILRTEELRSRPWRPPDHEVENSALAALTSALVDSPRTILQTLADKVLEVLHADSAGLSLLTKDQTRFYWAAISGEWGPHIGGGTPRDFGPCGDVLDRNIPMLFTHWERRYPYLGAALPLADEGLLVPFYVNGKSVGTIWAIAHNSHRQFDTEDLRLLESMGRFASAAYQTVESLEHLKAEIAARERAEEHQKVLIAELEVSLEDLKVEIAARERAEEHQKVLIAELDHRIKNVLARVTIVAEQTREGSSSMDQFVKTLDGRIKSMAAAHSLLSQTCWKGVGLTDLVRDQLAPYLRGANVNISGPNVMLNAAATQSMAMTLHELATNAAKYGALSTPTGQVIVSWERLVSNGMAAKLTLEWREADGPIVGAPRRSGFGTSLIRELIPHELSGTVDLVFDSDGVCCHIEVPLDQPFTSASAWA
jgi:two-component sensor histidine kinase